MSPTVAVVGSLNMDLVIQSPKIPQPGETVLSARSVQHFPGGKGANQAVAAARLGANVHMVGRIGDDSYGTDLLASLQNAGVNTTYIGVTQGTSTGVALIVVDAAGENSIVVASGANLSVIIEDIIEEVIAAADSVLLQLEIPLAINAHVASIAATYNTTVILNPAPAQQLPESLLQNVDVIIPNEGECELLTGQSISSEEDYFQASQALQALGPRTVVLTLGAKGAYLLHNDASAVIPAFKVEAVDTTAAGDAFVAGLAVALAERHDFAEAVRRANAAGGLAATRSGAQPSLPTREEWLHILNDS